MATKLIWKILTPGQMQYKLSKRKIVKLCMSISTNFCKKEINNNFKKKPLTKAWDDFYMKRGQLKVRVND